MDAKHDEHTVALNKAGVALEVLRYFLIQRGMLKLGLYVKRDIGNLAKAIGVPQTKIEQVLYPIFRSMLGEVFPSIDEGATFGFGISVETGEISRKILKHLLRNTNNVSLRPDGARAIISMAREIDFPVEMVVGFLRPIYEELLSEMFKTISIPQEN